MPRELRPDAARAGITEGRLRLRWGSAVGGPTQITAPVSRPHPNPLPCPRARPILLPPQPAVLGQPWGVTDSPPCQGPGLSDGVLDTRSLWSGQPMWGGYEVGD